MTRILAPVFLGTVLAFVSPALASWRPLTMAERAQQSDAIVIVTITDVQVTEVNKAVKGMARSVAVAHVEQSLKGETNGAAIRLPFDKTTAPAGSDPHYAKGERCLLFLRLVSPNTYTVLQSEFDKHLIKDEKVEDTDGQHGMRSVPLKDIVSQIKSLLSEKKESAQPPAGGDGKPAPQP